jgi:hypothetical protein
MNNFKQVYAPHFKIKKADKAFDETVNELKDSTTDWDLEYYSNELLNHVVNEENLYFTDGKYIGKALSVLTEEIETQEAKTKKLIYGTYHLYSRVAEIASNKTIVRGTNGEYIPQVINFMVDKLNNSQTRKMEARFALILAHDIACMPEKISDANKNLIVDAFNNKKENSLLENPDHQYNSVIKDVLDHHSSYEQPVTTVKKLQLN